MAEELLAFHFVVSLVISLEYAYAYCKVLRPKSNIRLVFVQLLATVLNYTLHVVGIDDIIRILAITLPAFVVFPIAIATGPLFRRILWIAIMPVFQFLGELTGSLTYYLLTGSMYYTAVTASNIVTIQFTYAVVVLASGLSSLLAISLHDHVDLEGSTVSTAPIAGLLVWSFVLVTFLMVRTFQISDAAVFPPPVTLILATAVIYVVLVLAMLSFMQVEAQAARTRADSAALVRQTKHMRAEILTSTQRLVALRRLRHDLTNHTSGISSERLATLPAQADRIANQ